MYIYGRLESAVVDSAFTGDKDDNKPGTWMLCKVPEDPSEGYDVVAIHYPNNDKEGCYVRIVTDRLDLSATFDNARISRSNDMDYVLREFALAITSTELSDNINSEEPVFTNEDYMKAEKEALGKGGILDRYMYVGGEYKPISEVTAGDIFGIE